MVVVVLFGGLVVFSKKDQVNVNGIDINKIQAATAESGNIGDHVYGNAKSKVLFVEYGDFQCPYCGQAYPNIKSLTTKYKQQIAFVFRNFPIITAHPNAKAAAAAAEAASLQGKYWEMHDKLYETQNEWSNASAKDRTTIFISYAKGLGLDSAKFTADMSSEVVTQKINFDTSVAKKANVEGTPTFVVNGRTVTEYALDGKVVSKDTAGAGQIWGDVTAFDMYIIQPELKKYNIVLPNK